MLYLFFSFIAVFGQGVFYGLVPNILLNARRNFKNGACNYRLVHACQLITLTVLFPLLASMSYVALGLYGVAAVFSIAGMILGDKKDKDGKISKAVLDFLKANEILLLTTVLLLLGLNLATCFTLPGLFCVAGCFFHLSYTLIHSLLETFNIKPYTWFSDLNKVHNQICSWFVTYYLCTVKLVAGVLAVSVGLMQAYSENFRSFMQRSKQFFKEWSFNKFLSTDSLKKTMNHKKQDHPYFASTMEHFATGVTLPPKPLKIDVTTGNTTVDMSASAIEEATPNSSSLAMKITSLHQQLIGNSNEDHHIYWNLAYLMSAEAKEKMHIANTLHLKSLDQHSFSHWINKYTVNSENKLKRFQQILNTTIDKKIKDGALLEKNKGKVYYKAQLMVKFFILKQASGEKFDSLFIFKKEQRSQQSMRATPQWSELFSDQPLTIVTPLANDCKNIMPIDPIDIARTMLNRLQDQFKNSEEADVFAKVKEHLAQWGAIYEFARAQPQQHDGLDRSNQLLLSMATIVTEFAEPIDVLLKKNGLQDQEYREAKQRLLTLFNRYDRTLGEITIDGSNARCFPLILKEFEGFLEYNEPLGCVNKALNTWAEHLFINEDPTLLKTPKNVDDFWYKERTYPNFFTKSWNMTLRGFGYIKSCVKALMGDVTALHDVTLMLQGKSKIQGEFHEKEKVFCEQAGALPFILGEGNDIYVKSAGPAYYGDYSGISGFDISCIEASQNFGLIRTQIIKPYLNTLYEQDGDALENSKKIMKLKTHFSSLINLTDEQWGELLEEHIEQKTIDALAETLVITHFINEGIFLSKKQADFYDAQQKSHEQVPLNTTFTPKNNKFDTAFSAIRVASPLCFAVIARHMQATSTPVPSRHLSF